MWSLIGYLPFFLPCIINKDRSFRSYILDFLYVAEGKRVLCMVLIRIVFLVLIILVLLSFSYVLMEPIKSQAAQALNVILFFFSFLCERSG